MQKQGSIFDFINTNKNNANKTPDKAKNIGSTNKEMISKVSSEDSKMEATTFTTVDDINKEINNPANETQKRNQDSEEIEQFNKETKSEILENNAIPYVNNKKETKPKSNQNTQSTINNTKNAANIVTTTNDSKLDKSTEKSYNFNDLAMQLSPLENVKGKGSKDIIKEAIANIFETLILEYPNDLVRVYYFLLCSNGPEYRTKEMGIGNEIVQKCVSKAIGKNEKIIRESMKEIGDLGIIAYEGKGTLGTMDGFFIKKTEKTEEKIITMKNIFDSYNDIVNLSGNSSVFEKEKILLKLLFNCKKDEIKFLVRSLYKPKTLKIGASFKTIISSLARGIYKIYTDKHKTKKSHNISEKEIERTLLVSINQMPDYDIIMQQVIELVSNGVDFMSLLDRCPITLGIPLRPMLAKPTTGIQIIFQRFEGVPFTCEWKYDGFRGQIHGYRNEDDNFIVQVFSRNLENMTEAYPDVVQFFMDNFSDKSFILDCEIVPYDPNTNKILPFQTLTTRSRKNVNLKDITVKVCLFLFDIIYLNGQTYIDVTLEERRKILMSNFKETDEIKFAVNITSENAEDIETIMKEAVDAGKSLF